VPDISTQYRIIAEGAGWIDRSDRGRLQVRGADRVAFLQALISNDLAGIGPGQGVYATWLTPQGRMITDLRVHERPDALLADVPAALAPELAVRLDQLIFAEDVQVADVTAELAVLAVIGGGAAGALGRAAGIRPSNLDALDPLGHLELAGDLAGGFAARTDDVDGPAFELWVPAGARDAAVGALAGADAAEISAGLFEAMRIDAGRPRFGADMTSETIPLEAGLLDRAISTGKGCYVGQEVIIRVLHRGGGRVARRLVKLRFDRAVRDLPPAGAPLVSEGTETGRLTSVAWSPAGDHAIGLGYVHRDVAVTGRAIEVRAASGPASAEITGLAG
jgi:folate-binding protein YgfZ